MAPVAVRRALLAGLAFFVVTHLVALAAMAIVLRSGMDPAAGSVEVRMAWVAENATAWRLGWLPWQLSALSDVWVSIALVAWARAAGDGVAVRVAMLGVALDLVGVVPEQWAEAMIVTSFIHVGDADEWRRLWGLYAELTGVWANWAYTAMTACWMIVAARMLGRPVTHRVAEGVVLVLFVVSGALTLAATRAATDADTAHWFAVSTVANGIAFPALVAWACVLAWRIARAQGRGMQQERQRGS